MKPNLLFYTLEQIESTNNYAMGKIHEGLAVHGMAFYTSNQTSGKGQRGKYWEGKPGENIALSIVLTPNHDFVEFPFLFNAWIALICRSYLSKLINENVKIKWPNDIIINDRKAGGILIENKFRGNYWCWSVVGVGINVNQLEFSGEAKYPISLKQISGKTYNLEDLARGLHIEILNTYQNVGQLNAGEIWKEYRQNLYKIGQDVFLKIKNEIIETTIVGVNETGQLMTKDIIERTLNFGEVEWIVS